MATVADMLKRPDSFGYFGGDTRMFKTWSFGPVIETRDSGALERANARALLAALPREGFVEDTSDSGSPGEEGLGDYYTTEANHWAVGWVKHLCFRVLEEDGSTSRIATFLEEWFRGLAESYSVADEDLLAEEEAEDEDVAWDSWARTEFGKGLTARFPLYEAGLDAASSETLHDLFREGMACLGQYWEHSSGGPSCDMEAIVETVEEKGLQAVGIRATFPLSWLADDWGTFQRLLRLLPYHAPAGAKFHGMARYAWHLPITLLRSMQH